MLAVGDALLVNSHPTLLDQALSALAVGGEASVDEQVEDTYLSSIVGFVAEGAIQWHYRHLRGHLTVLELALEVSACCVCSFDAVVYAHYLPGQVFLRVHRVDAAFFEALAHALYFGHRHAGARIQNRQVSRRPP